MYSLSVARTGKNKNNHILCQTRQFLVLIQAHLNHENEEKPPGLSI